MLLRHRHLDNQATNVINEKDEGRGNNKEPQII